jgi:hypothetical protein
MEKLTAESITAALVYALEIQFVSPEVFSVEDITTIPGIHMEDEERVTATCHYRKDVAGEHIRWQVEFYYDQFDECVYADSQL